jgi:hypothetical protein
MNLPPAITAPRMERQPLTRKATLEFSETAKKLFELYV